MIPPPPHFATGNSKVSLSEKKERVWYRANKHIPTTEVVDDPTTFVPTKQVVG